MRNRWFIDACYWVNAALGSRGAFNFEGDLSGLSSVEFTLLWLIANNKITGVVLCGGEHVWFNVRKALVRNGLSAEEADAWVAACIALVDSTGGEAMVTATLSRTERDRLIVVAGTEDWEDATIVKMAAAAHCANIVTNDKRFIGVVDGDVEVHTVKDFAGFLAQAVRGK